MPAGGLAVAGLGLLIGGGEALFGAHDKKKYQSQIDALNSNRPQYQINPEEYNIQNLAESRANQGMGAGARQQLQNNTDRGLATTANAALMGGADANTLGGIVDKSQNAYNQNAVYDDQARLQNLNNMQQSWARMSANEDKKWNINTEQPWKDKMTALNQQLTGANNMMMGGINLAAGGLMSGVGKAFSGGGGSGGSSGGGGGDSEGSPGGGDSGASDSYGGGGNDGSSAYRFDQNPSAGSNDPFGDYQNSMMGG